MKTLYDFPKAAVFGRKLPKSKIFEYAAPGSKVKELFVNEVDKIVWAYKLSPTTINLPASEGVHEIQVFTITLKTSELSPGILATIDKAIPSPILFELQHESKIKYAAAPKRPSEADKSKWVVSNYYESGWLSADTVREKLPVALNMGALYQSLLAALSPSGFRKDEDLSASVSRIERLQAKEKEVERLANRIKREKQFNRRVELNRVLNELKQEIESLKS